jgi:cell division protein ZapA (FtsZ GTPase activity inhibitor)
MTVKNEGLEYNILGCPIRMKANEGDSTSAKLAVDLVNKEIETLRGQNPSLKDIETAGLVALKLASEKIEIEGEYKENVFSLRSGITDALNFIEEVSPGSMQSTQSE